MKDPAVVKSFEIVMRNELAAAYGTPERAFQREKAGNGWRYWCAGTEAAYEKFLAGWTAAKLSQQAKTGNPVLPENKEVTQQASGQDREDPLQPAANWLVNAANLTATQVAGNLCIGINRAQRLYDAARAAAKGQ